MTTGSLCLTEILMSWKSCSANRLASHSADSASASGVALPYFSISRLSSEPALTPIRIGVPWSLAAAAISLTLSSNFRMLPGFTRTAAQPASIAANTYFGWKWMSAITGICDLRRDRRQRVGVVLARAGDPHDVAAGRGELGDLLQRGVDVGGQGGGHRLHGDRVLAADADRADLQLPGRPARGQGRGRRDGHAQGDAHDLQYPSPATSIVSASFMASSISVSTMACSGTVLITSPLTKIWPLPLPEATPRSASRASPGPVHHAAHHGHPQRHLHPGEPGGDLVGQLVHVHLGPPAGRAGDDLQLARSQVQRLQDLGADLDLLDRRRGQRDPDGVPDPLAQQRPEGDRGLDRALERRSGLGDPEVQRVVALLARAARRRGSSPPGRGA